MYGRSFKHLNTQSFFLFGPRGTGKSTWLKSTFKEALFFDLLDEALYQDLLRSPALFETKLNLAKPHQWVVLDEIQRIPGLLNYVHKAIVEKGTKFILTGSSARKLRKENANLLAGRALNRKFNPLTAEELGDDYDVSFSLKYGQLPAVIKAPVPQDYLRSYVGTYLREEVQQEALVRNLSTFARFMEMAAFSQAQTLSAQSIALDVGVDRKTVEAYIKILEDLLVAYTLPVFKKRSKRKMTVRPKFYYFDVGVYRTLRKRGPLDPIEEIEGAAIETLVCQELKALIDNLNLDLEIYFYRTTTKQEVDFILYGNDGFFAIEVKRSSRLRREDLEHIVEFKKDYKEAVCFLFYLGTEEIKTNEGVHVLPLPTAMKSLKKLIGVRESNEQ